MDLKQLRENRGMRQEQVAKEVGISRTTYTNIENHKTRPSVIVAKKIARLFAIKWDTLFEEDGAKQ